MKRAQHRRRAYPDSQQQAHSDEHFDRSDQVSEKYRMGQNQIGQNRLVEADRAVLGEALEILLKSAVGKLRAENLVLAEKQERKST